MIQGKRVLGVILARSGSKGLPGKNLMHINGRPLISWSINSGKNSSYIDDLIVSTDGDEIARLCVNEDVEVPFLRPAELANDTASSFDAVIHAINWLSDRQRFYDIVVLLEPTSPLRESSDIDRALEIMQELRSSSIVSISRAETQHPSFMYYLGLNKRLEPFLGEYFNSVRRQDLDKLYFLDGTVYCSYIDKLIEKKGFYHEETSGYVVPKWKSLEIDDKDDFIMVEALMKYREL
jgi:CMP-N,N'-diacetyllegionaminic acid synthase